MNEKMPGRIIVSPSGTWRKYGDEPDGDEEMDYVSDAEYHELFMATQAQSAQLAEAREALGDGLLAEIGAECERARRKHAPMHSPHEAYGVIGEEFDEFWDEVRAQQHDKAAMRKELIQTAAMCVRAIRDLNLAAAEAKEEEKPVPSAPASE